MPDFDMNEMRFGPLRFGDSFREAAFLGQPDRSDWIEKDYCALLYAAEGFQMDFEKGRFVYLAFFIGPDRCLPEHAALKYCEPQLRGGALDGVSLSSNVDRAVLRQWFGEPEAEDTDAEESILSYTRNQLVMEFEFDGASGHLKRWNIFPKD